MNYRGKQILLTGARGFIGKKLSGALYDQGAIVNIYTGDIRNYAELKSRIDHNLDYVFHFAAPSSQVLFKRNIQYCMESTIQGFMSIAKLCKTHGVKLIYPSTGILSQGATNEYARAKKICEDIHLGSGLDALGLRIFAGYGIGEAHKRDYASVPHLFLRNRIEGITPVVYGDGEQVRDFIYIDDLVKAILVLAENASEQIIDVGSGSQTSFNEIIQEVRMQAGSGVIESIKIPAPEGYVQETKCDVSVLKKYNCLPTTTIRQGIRLMWNFENKNRDAQLLEEGLQ